MNDYKFEQFDVGISHSFEVEITEEMMQNFFAITGDNNPMHMDVTYASEHGFQGRIVYGMLTASLYSTLAGVYMPGKYCLLQEVNTSFYKPVYIGDKLIISGVVKEKNDILKRSTIHAKVVNQEGKRVSKAVIMVGFYE